MTEVFGKCSQAMYTNQLTHKMVEYTPFNRTEEIVNLRENKLECKWEEGQIISSQALRVAPALSDKSFLSTTDTVMHNWAA